jgi:2-keto-3-deoxy-L-rhamnonate aldolase RhmA
VVWFDIEHRAFGSTKSTPSHWRAASGLDLMVRISQNRIRQSDESAGVWRDGSMVPHCCSAEEAKQWVDWVRFPPAGKRGLDGVGANVIGVANSETRGRAAIEVGASGCMS